MLTNSFIHIPGVGKTVESALWSGGCHTWTDALDRISEVSFGSAGTDLAKSVLEKSIAALEGGNHQFFTQGLGLANAWRAWPEFRHRCTYVDIETDGGRDGSSITTIGAWDGTEFQVFVRGQNLENFRDYISNYSMIVTFFGASFDLPIILKKFKKLELDQIHLDLCPTLRTLGVTGGLKKIEKQLGIQRGEDTDGLSGFDAIRLWRRYQIGDEEALKTLIAYNREDVVNLEALANYAYTRLRQQVFESVINPA